MEATLQMPFNSAQIEVIQILSEGLSESEMKELRAMLIAFRFKILEDQVVKVAAQKGLTIGEINAASRGHRRTDYRAKKTAA